MEEGRTALVCSVYERRHSPTVESSVSVSAANVVLVRVPDDFAQRIKEAS